MRISPALPVLFLAATAAGYLMSLLGAPLPWMIGPLVLTAAATASGLFTERVPTRIRPFGQITVATFVGAHFTPEALHALLATAPLLIAVSLWVLMAAMLVARLQRRLFGGSLVANFLAVVPTSPVEAVVMAEHHGVPTAPVILSQTLRIALVVTVIPILLYAGTDGPAPSPEALRRDGLTGAALTLAGALLGPVLFRAIRLANPYFLGPLFMAALISSLDLPAFDMPGPLLAAAQIVLGTWLGGAFRRELLGGPLLGSALLSSGLLLATCGLGAWALSRVFGAPFATVMLGIAPGGVTEMALTAGILAQDVALVTAMHLTRIFVIMPNAGWIARLSNRADASAHRDTGR
ncbi:AbrB family transcriptional regulator [Mameliella alba]|uniref:AbrB family transcriptional regulator n=1 Tax=Mameliella alba TaxID=561184 RepID=UPI0014306BBC|nr:AbrB family transcriptional regulator [Mameliella alba]